MTDTTQQQNRSVAAFSRIFEVRGSTSMIKFLIRRVLTAIPVLFAIMLVTFTLTHLLPGGPFDHVGDKQMPEYMVRQLEQKAIKALRHAIEEQAA